MYLDNSPKRQKFWQKLITDVPGRAKKLLGLCKTRWVERHRALDRFFEQYSYLITLLEATVNPSSHPEHDDEKWDWDAETRIKAQGLLTSLQNFGNIVAFVVLRSALQPLAGIASKLQLRSLDICKAYSEIDEVASELSTTRENMEDYFDVWYSDALLLAGKAGTEESAPRTNKRQNQRDNVPHSSPKEYYYRSIAVPFVDHLIVEFGSRFDDHNRQAVSNLIKLVPSVLVSGEKANPEELCALYGEVMPASSGLKCELVRWNAVWTKHASEGGVSPDSLVDTLNKTSRDRFPNIYAVLAIGCCLPVGSCEAERSFSVLRRTKNYLRSTMTEDRLTNLSLMVIHFDVNLDLDELADRFIRAHPHRLFDASLLDRD